MKKEITVFVLFLLVASILAAADNVSLEEEAFVECGLWCKVGRFFFGSGREDTALAGKAGGVWGGDGALVGMGSGYSLPNCVAKTFNGPCVDGGTVVKIYDTAIKKHVPVTGFKDGKAIKGEYGSSTAVSYYTFIYQRAKYEEKAGSKTSAQEMLKTAADKGNPYALYDLAKQAEQSKSVVSANDLYEKAIPGLQSAADKGDTKAALILHDVFQRGLGTDSDSIMAQKYLIMAGDKGNAETKIQVGKKLMEQGQYSKAKTYFKDVVDKESSTDEEAWKAHDYLKEVDKRESQAKSKPAGTSSGSDTIASNYDVGGSSSGMSVRSGGASSEQAVAKKENGATKLSESTGGDTNEVESNDVYDLPGDEDSNNRAPDSSTQDKKITTGGAPSTIELSKPSFTEKSKIDQYIDATDKLAKAQEKLKQAEEAAKNSRTKYENIGKDLKKIPDTATLNTWNENKLRELAGDLGLSVFNVDANGKITTAFNKNGLVKAIEAKKTDLEKEQTKLSKGGQNLNSKVSTAKGEVQAAEQAVKTYTPKTEDYKTYASLERAKAQQLKTTAATEQTKYETANREVTKLKTEADGYTQQAKAAGAEAAKITYDKNKVGQYDANELERDLAEAEKTAYDKGNYQYAVNLGDQLLQQLRGNPAASNLKKVVLDNKAKALEKLAEQKKKEADPKKTTTVEFLKKTAEAAQTNAAAAEEKAKEAEKNYKNMRWAGDWITDSIQHEDTKKWLFGDNSPLGYTVGSGVKFLQSFGRYRGLSNLIMPGVIKDWTEATNSAAFRMLNPVGEVTKDICDYDERMTHHEPGQSSVFIETQSGSYQFVGRIQAEVSSHPVYVLCDSVNKTCPSTYVCKKDLCYQNEDDTTPELGYLHKIDWGVTAPSDEKHTPYIDENNKSVKFNVMLKYKGKDVWLYERKGIPVKEVIALTNGESDRGLILRYFGDKATEACVKFSDTSYSVDRFERKKITEICAPIKETSAGTVEYGKSSAVSYRSSSDRVSETKKDW